MALAQAQAQVAQSSARASFESLKGAKDPQTAFEEMKTSAQQGVALLAKNLKDATALGVDQFNQGVDAIGKSHPSAEAFVTVGKNLKAAASTAEHTFHSMLEKGMAAAATSTESRAKKAH